MHTVNSTECSKLAAGLDIVSGAVLRWISGDGSGRRLRVPAVPQVCIASRQADVGVRRQAAAPRLGCSRGRGAAAAAPPEVTARTVTPAREARPAQRNAGLAFR